MPSMSSMSLSGSISDHASTQHPPLQQWVSSKRYKSVQNSPRVFLTFGHQIKEIEEEMARSRSLSLSYRAVIDRSV